MDGWRDGKRERASETGMSSEGSRRLEITRASRAEYVKGKTEGDGERNDEKDGERAGAQKGNSWRIVG